MTIKKNYTHNHYVPEWYQKRFMHNGQGKYWYLDLRPDVRELNGHRHTRNSLHLWGPRSCFAENNLYTIKQWGDRSADMEKFFFGRIDSEGKDSVEYFSKFSFPFRDPNESHEKIVRYMSVQKLRTPKGLQWLRAMSKKYNKTDLLSALHQMRHVFCATWSESIWQIADASQSKIKFIISDHPVTVYNRACFPGSVYCRGLSDPDIRCAATHTYFPLSMEKILIMTNLSWVRDPYQNERKYRPNPEWIRDTLFNFLEIQVHRSLNEREVLEINHITKMRAFRYVAGAEKEWLYPERNLKSTHWSKFDGGFLFMPEPRNIFMVGETLISYENGHSDAFNEYGQKPWEEGYEDEKRFASESKSLEQFKLEWAVKHGPVYRGTSADFGRDGETPYVTPEKFHKIKLQEAKKLRQGLKRSGKRARNRLA